MAVEPDNADRCQNQRTVKLHLNNDTKTRPRGCQRERI